MERLTKSSLEQVVLAEARRSIGLAFMSFGYSVTLLPAVAALGARRARVEDPDAGPLQVLALIRRAAERKLIKTVRDATPAGSVIQLTPDDL